MAFWKLSFKWKVIKFKTLPLRDMRLRDLLKNNLFLIWFGAFMGALASQMLQTSLAKCGDRSYWPWWIPAEYCPAITIWILFPIALAGIIMFSLAAFTYWNLIAAFVKKLLDPPKDR